MALTQEQIAQLRGQAGLAVTPPQNNFDNVLDQRKKALGLDTFGERAKSIISTAGEDIANKLTDTQSEQSPVNRGTEAAAEAFTVPTKLAFEALPEKGRENLNDIGGAVGGGFNWLTDKISHTKLFDELGKLEADGYLNQETAPELSRIKDRLGTVSSLGTIAGEIVGTGEGAKALNFGKDLVAGGLESGANTIENMLKNKALKASEAPLKDALEITKPVLNKKESIAAFERAGQKGGVNEKFEYQSSQHDIDVANSVKDIISKKNSPIDNNININTEIGRISEQEVRPFLRKNPAIFNQKTLNAYIRDNVKLPNFIKADPVLQKTYDLARDSMLEEVSKFPKNMEGLWDARISFDNVLEKQLGSLDPLSEKASAIKQAALDTRRAVNEYITENTPNGDELFKGKIRKISNMYEARSNIAESNYKLMDKNFVERWVKQNPKKAALAKKLGLLAGFGLGIDILK